MTTEQCPLCKGELLVKTSRSSEIIYGHCQGECRKKPYGELRFVQCLMCKQWSIDDDEDSDFRCFGCGGSYCQCCWSEQTDDYPESWDQDCKDCLCRQCREESGEHEMGKCVQCEEKIVIDDVDNSQCQKCKSVICESCTKQLLPTAEAFGYVCVPCGGKKKERPRKRSKIYI